MKRIFLTILIALLWAMPASAMICLDDTDTLEGGASVDAVVDYTVFGLNVSTFANLAQGQLSDTDPSVLYTATAGTSIVSVVFVNTHTSAVTVNLYLDPANAGTPRRLIPKNLSLGAGYSMVFDGQRCTVLDDDGGVLGSYAGVLPIARGGTGETAASAAFDALSPMTTIGDLIYGGASGTGTRLAAGATTEILVGGGAAAPVWTTATGTGAPVRANSPSLVTPEIGAATGTSIDLSSTINAAGNGTLDGADPSWIFDGSTASDTDFWMGLVADEGGDDNDIFQIGKGTTPGTDPYVTIDNGGKVGIGTATPDNLLNLYGVSPLFSIEDSGTGAHGFVMKDTTQQWNFLSGSGSDDFKIRDVTSGVDALYVKKGGNVGIGTASPGYELEVDGDIYASGDVSALTFTDRTPWFDGDAVAAIKNIKGIDGEIDHSSLPVFAQGTIKKYQKETVLGPRVPVDPANAWEEYATTENRQVKDAKGDPVIEKIETIYKAEDGKIKTETKPVYQIVETQVPKKRLKEGVKLDSKTGEFYTQTSTVEKTVIAEIPGRDLGAMISVLTKAVQQLTERIEALENPLAVEK